MATLEEIRKSLGLEEPKEDDRLTAVRASLGLEQAEAPIPPRKPPPPAPAYAPIPQPQKPRLAPKYSQFGQSLEANVRGIRGGAAGLAGDVLSEAGIAPRTSERLGRFAGREQELERQAQTMLTAPDYRDIKDWEGFFDWLGAGAGAAAAQLPYFVTAHTLGGPAGTVGAALPLSYSEVKGASKQAGIDPLKQYNIPGTGIELTGRQMQMIGALPHAGIEVFGLQRYLGGNSSFVSSLIQELGEEAAQYLVAEAVASAQKNRDVIPFVKESFEAGKLKEAGAQMINAIPQVTFMMGVTGAAKNLADRATAAERPPQARPAPAAAPVAPPPVSPTPETPAPPQPPPAKPYVSPFREHKIRDIPERPEAPLRRPGVPGEPFRREAPAAPEAPPPGPPAPPAPPATVEPPVTAPGEPASWATVRMVVANDLASQKDVLTALTVITRLAADPKTREAARWKEQKSLAEALHRKARELGATKEQINRAQSDEVVWPRVFAPEPTVEPTEQGPQTVIPGAERISDKEAIERKADERIKPKVPQAPMDEGIFDTGARKQGDLIDEIKRVKPEPERDEIDRYLNILRGARAMPKKPKTMTQWVKEAGGVTDPQGEIKQIIGQASARPGLINNKSGKDIDDMALLAWEAGFFPDAAERPDVRTFLDALAADARGESVRIDPRDAELSAEWDAIADLDELLNQLDIDVKALKNDEIKHLIESESLPPEAFSGRPGTRASWMPGGRYVGAVEQKFEPDRERRKAKDIRRREDILRPLLKDLGVPLYQGRLKSRKLLGRYKRKIEEVRIKNMNDIEVAAHELAHMLDDRFPEIRKQWLPATKANKAIREELRGVSYDASKLYEGFAEFVRLWATQKQKALEAAPQFYSWFEGFLGRNKHGPALRRAQAEMHDWFAQDQVSQLASKIGVQESINAGLSTRWQRWRQGIFDDLRRIYDAEKKVSGDINDVGPYVTARLTRSKYAMIEGVLKLGQIKIAGAGERYLPGAFYFEGKSLVDILTPIGANLDDWLYYSVARSARELKQQGRERLLTNAEIEAGLALETPAFDQAFNDYQEWNKSIVDFAVAKGAINPEKRAKWARSQYIPFYRAGSRTPQATGRPTGDWKGIKRLTGGTQNLRPILDNIIGNASMLIDAALTNEARVKVADLVEGPQGAHFMTEVPKDNAKVLVLKESIREAAKENISRQIDAELQKAIKKGDEAEVDLAEKADQQREWMEERVDELFDEIPGIYLAGLMEIPPRGDKIVAVLRGGEPTYYEVIDDLMYSSLKRLNRPPKHWITRVLAFPKRLGQASITFSIDFMMRNISRDTIMGLVMSKSGFIPWYDSIRGMASRIYQDENYRLAIANGVGFSSYLVDEDAMRSHISKFASREGINPSTILDTPAKFILAVERLADAFEMSTRLGEFRRAVEAGVHPRQAAYRAREVSTDFAMRGDWDSVGFAYDTIIFLKAAMNSWDRLYRGLTEDTNRGKIAGLSASIAMASIALYLVNRGNPGYDDLEDWEKDAYWHFFVGDQHFRYPKIWEIGAMASIAERTVEKFLDGQPEQLAADYWRIMRDVMNVEYMPQAVAPLFEQAINRIRFIDRPIETQSMQELDPALRIGPRTSETLRALGKAERKLPPELQVSPVRVEALLRGYLNTWALYGLTMSDAMFFDDQPDLSIHEYPVFRTFWPKPAEKRHTRYETEFYDAVRDASQLRRNVRQALNLWGRDIAREYAEDPRQALRPFLNTQKKTMDAINDNTNRIRNMRSLEELRTYAEAIGRGQMGPQVRALQQTEAWNHKGKLKAELLDMWSAKRSAFAKQSMQQLQKMRQRQKEMP